MIIKIFFNKIVISKYTLFLLLICFITGLIKEISAVFILIIFHEFGHYIASYIFNWNIDKITIYPFGGIITYDENIDKPLKEEFIITILGPINQLIIYFIFVVLNKKYIISDTYLNIMSNYNISMLIFNLLPVIPLDGSKLLNIFLNKILNYRLAYNILSFISFIFIVFFINKYKNNYSYFIIISFLLYELFNYIKNRKYMFNRFIFEKYLYKNKYKKYIKINNINKMKRNKKHIIKLNNMYMSEKDAIKKIKGV